MFPNELIFFVFLLVVGLLILLRFKKIINRKIKIFFIFYLLIVLQTLFHNSLWSPITYITYFFAPDQITRDQFTWFAFLFPDGSGAVNADYISVHNLQKYSMDLNTKRPRVSEDHLRFILFKFYIFCKSNIRLSFNKYNFMDVSSNWNVLFGMTNY